MNIQEYVNAKIDNQVNAQNYHISTELGISNAMLSHYRTGRTKIPNLSVARKIYSLEGVVIYPYSSDAVSKDII